MTTLILGGFGCGDLAAEAALSACVTLPGPRWVETADAAAARRVLPGCRPLPPGGPLPEGVRLAVLTGPLHPPAERTAALIGRLGELAARGAAIRLHAVSFQAWGPLHRPAPALRAVLERLESVSARDHRTLDSLLEWRCPWMPTLDPFPGAWSVPELPADRPAGKLLGLAIRDGGPVRQAAEVHGARIAALVERYAGWTVLPLPVVRREGEPDDLRAARDFAARFLPDSPVLDPWPEHPDAWRAEATPARLAGWLGACDAVVAGRDLAIALAASRGVPCLALAPHAEDEAGRAAGTLADRLVPGSRYVVLPATGPAS
ncbi:hypothetical protein LPC08_19330 [Roseomonas sp. OT10]|uniref:hypothetical protein n=1 Tax=Roseomonas cutis TaxID=2897332 RepID=UPI001E44BA0E|nr:hypothetical protein [Roseomonas sp. OT10]UFN48146.1 hypothetical protein LPC08_19330 [Roseomonas sp. OT10]